MKAVIAMPKMGNDPFRIYMKSKYIFSLRRSGAKVRWIPLDNMEESIPLLLQCDGLLMPGGVDIEPDRYGQIRSEKCGKSDLKRDEAEWQILEAFLPTKKPVLCICRGVQMLNVFQGGTLHQDIPGHSDFKSRSTGCHSVMLTPESRLRQILQTSEITVNSLHHQAADRIGTGLRVAAVSSDGITEALELENHPFCIGVQWHPEHLSRHQNAHQRIFDAFVKACKP